MVFVPSICAARSSPCRNPGAQYNEKTRWLLSIVQLLSYVIAKASVTIYAGAVVFNSFLGVDSGQGDCADRRDRAYTVFGGLHAVMYTEHCKPSFCSAVPSF